MMVLLGVAPAFGGCGGCALQCATGSQVPPSAGNMVCRVTDFNEYRPSTTIQHNRNQHNTNTRRQNTNRQHVISQTREVMTMFVNKLGYMRNLTPHDINLMLEDGDLLAIPKSGEPFRLMEQDQEGNNPLIVRRRLVHGRDLPSPAWISEKEQECACQGPQHGVPGEAGACQCGKTYFWPVLYIVSLPALMGLAAEGVCRGDLVAPDTGATAIRNETGQVTAVRRFVRLQN